MSRQIRQRVNLFYRQTHALSRTTMPKRKQPAFVAESCIPISYSRSSNVSTPIIDTHTHLLSTFEKFKQTYPQSAINDIFSFVRWLYDPSILNPKVEAIVDVWCDAPVIPLWKELADSAVDEKDRKEKWNGIEYWFVMGVHPHNAKDYNDEVEQEIFRAMQHPRCVGWGEMGLDYHYDNSPREVQRQVFIRQLRNAVRLKKPLTIHTREAEADTEAILKAEVPRDHPIHIHCFTDGPEFASRLLDHFPHLYIGITGVITYATNPNTSNVIRDFITSSKPLRILFETDAPFMIPSNIYRDMPKTGTGATGKLPMSHTAMIPWTAEWVVKVAQEANEAASESWNVERILNVGKRNAKIVYDI